MNFSTGVTGPVGHSLCPGPEAFPRKPLSVTQTQGSGGRAVRSLSRKARPIPEIWAGGKGQGPLSALSPPRNGVGSLHKAWTKGAESSTARDSRLRAAEAEVNAPTSQETQEAMA